MRGHYGSARSRVGSPPGGEKPRTPTPATVSTSTDEDAWQMLKVAITVKVVLAAVLAAVAARALSTARCTR